MSVRLNNTTYFIQIIYNYLWEQKKAKFFSGGATSDSNDVIALQGINAANAGFGIGLGLGYEKLVEN